MIASAINCFSYRYELDSSKFIGGQWDFGFVSWNPYLPEPIHPPLDTMGDLSMDSCRSIYESLRGSCCGSLGVSIRLSYSAPFGHKYWSEAENKVIYLLDTRVILGGELQITRGCINA